MSMLNLTEERVESLRAAGKLSYSRKRPLPGGKNSRIEFYDLSVRVERPTGHPSSKALATLYYSPADEEKVEAFLLNLSSSDATPVEPTAPQPTPDAPSARRTLRFSAHVDDYAPGQAGPKTRKVSAAKAKRIRAEHNQIHAYLTEMGTLRLGDEIKTSRDDLRSVLGAASHMHFTATQEGREVTARLFVNQDVASEVASYVWVTFGVDIISITVEVTA